MTDKQKDGKTGRQTDRQNYPQIQREIETDRHNYTQIQRERYTDRQNYTQIQRKIETERQNDRMTYTQTDRQTEGRKDGLLFANYAEAYPNGKPFRDSTIRLVYYTCSQTLD